MLTKPTPLDPELKSLLDKVRKLPPMTLSQRRNQRISFVYGQLSLSGSNLTREEVERIQDETYGVPKES